MNYFSLRTKVYFGEGELKVLREIKCTRAFIVTDPFILESGVIDSVTAHLKAAHIDFEIFSNIVPDPPIETVAAGIKAMDLYNPDAVIAIGGGSAIDAAKSISYFSGLIKKGFKSEFKKPLCIAIPTTSGTGSEVTSFSVISDKKANMKYPLIEEDMIPDIAILDAVLVKTVPKSITADTGIDVLTHAIEAYVSNISTAFTDALSEKAIKLVFSNLKKAYDDGMNIDARKNMHIASCIAGMAFNNASLGINHSMAHILGGRFNIAHGKANAIILPYVIEFNANSESVRKGENSSAANKYAEIARFLDLTVSRNTSEGVRALILEIKRLIKSVGIPDRIKNLNIGEAEFEENLSEMCDIALKDRCTLTNPRETTKEELVKLFRRAYNGR